MKIGYARTSTFNQQHGLETQIEELTAAGYDNVLSEQVSSVNVAARVKLELSLEFVREDDTLVVTKLYRLARSILHLLEVLDRVLAMGASLEIPNMGIDTGTPTGKLMLSILGSVAAFEREITLERQRERSAGAKAAGKCKGRTPTARAKSWGARSSSQRCRGN